jgi:D-glycerate 3-kinase
LPSFDKTAYQGYGDRRPADEGAEVRDTLDIFIFEGWSQGFLPIRESALRERYEAMHDPRHRPHFSDHGIGCLLQVDTMLDEYVREWYPFISAFVQVSHGWAMTDVPVLTFSSYPDCTSLSDPGFRMAA